MEENEEKVSNIKWIIFLILLIGVLVYTIVVKLTYKPDLTNVYIEEANTILFLANTIDKFNKSGIIEESKPNNINISVLRKDKEYKITSEKGVFVNEIKGSIDNNIITFEFSEILENEDDIKSIFVEFFDDICQTKGLKDGNCVDIAKEFFETKESNNGIVFINEENKIKIKIDINFEWENLIELKYNFNELIPILEKDYILENETLKISNISSNYDTNLNTFSYSGVIEYKTLDNTSEETKFNNNMDINIYDADKKIINVENKDLKIEENVNNNTSVISLTINFNNETFKYDDIGYISIGLKEE